jgi:putative cell wall-binding protein
MRYKRVLAMVLVSVLFVSVVAPSVAAARMSLPPEIEYKLMPVTRLVGGVNAGRASYDVNNDAAAWIEPTAGGAGPVHFIDESNVESIVTTAAIAARGVAIGGRIGSAVASMPLVAYMLDTSGVQVANPVSGEVVRFVLGAGADSVQWDFSRKWVVWIAGTESGESIYQTDVETGDTTVVGSGTMEPSIANLRINGDWVSWSIGTTVYAKQLTSSASVTAAVPDAGSTTIIERLFCSSGGGLSWTQYDGTGPKKIYHLPYFGTATEIAPGVSKDMGGFDGNFATWFEGYGAAGVKTRAQALYSNGYNEPGDQMTFTEFDPAGFAWDFDTFLWQQRGTNKLFLTRFYITPPRVVGGQRYQTLANLATLWYGTSFDAVRAGEAAVQAAPIAIGRPGSEVVVCAGYDNASPDAIVAPGLCGVLSAPMVLVSYRTVPAETAAAIAKLRDRNGGSINIRVIGGPTAISKKCYAQLSALKGAGTIERIGGRDRYTTATLVAKRMKSLLAAMGEAMPAEVMLVNGWDKRRWDYAASTGAIQAGQHIPVLFVRRTSVPSVTTRALKSLGLTRRYIIGNVNAVSDRVRKRVKGAAGDRISGRDRYSMSMAIIAWGRGRGWFLPGARMMLAGRLHEALAAGALNSAMVDVSTVGAEGSAAPSARSRVSMPVALCAPTYMPSGLDADLAGLAAASEPGFFMLIGGQYSASDTITRRLLELFGWRLYGGIY